MHEWYRVRGDLPETQPRSRRYSDPQFLFRRNAVGPGPGLGSLHGAGKNLLGKAVGRAYVFLNNRSNAFRASSALRGAGGPPTICDGWVGGAEAPLDVPSRATVTLGANSVQVFVLSFSGIRSGMGFRHWNRVEGSKCVHCLQQCSSALHFGQVPPKSTSGDRAVVQLKQREAATC